LHEFVDVVRHNSQQARWFWLAQDVPGVLERWAHTLPRGHVHVVTVPALGVANTELWSRFTTLVGIDSGGFDLTSGRSNTSIRAEQAELLRQLNSRLGSRLPMPQPYLDTVKDLLTHELLEGRPGTRFGLVREDRAFAVRRSKEMVADLQRLGVDVVGDLDDLVPSDEIIEEASGDASASPQSVLEESIEALAAVLARLSTQQLEHAAADTERNRLILQIQRHPIRHLLVAQSKSRPWLGAVAAKYRTARDTVSKSAYQRDRE
ncbi:MAG: hypothetical protein ACRDQ1_07460, partial [Sciscionella sp.]